MDDNLLNEIRINVRSLTVEEFARRHEGLYLLGRYPGSGQGSLEFKTRIRAVRTDTLIPLDDLPKTEADEPERIWKVEKTDRNAWRRRIAVGRATNNDIVIRHHTVSKLHAHFYLPKNQPLDQAVQDSLLLVDVGSSNGTFVNGDPLMTDVGVAVSSGDRINFAKVSCQLLDAKMLYSEILRRDFG